MMDRRIFLTTVAGGLLAAPLAVEAQQAGKLPRLGILPPGPLAGRRHLWDAFRQGLRELGYVEGQNVTLVFPSGEVRPERLAEIATNLVRLNVDVIVTSAEPAILAARDATKTIPIVMAASTDPVEGGFITSLARPGGNVTGLCLISEQLIGKRLELLKAAVPGVSRIAIISNPTNPAVTHHIRAAETSAKALGLQNEFLEVRDTGDFGKAFLKATRGRAGALMALDDALIFTHRALVVRLAAENRLPAIYGFREFIDVGGLMVYAGNLASMYRRAATYVDKILKGAKPADLPVEQPTKFELVINLKTAKALGLTIPPSVLGRADEVIE